jgi:hypothetical protein
MNIYLHLRNGLAIPIALTLTLSSSVTLVFAGTSQAAHNQPAKISKAAPAATPGPSAEAQPELTPTTLLGLVRTAKILDPEYPVQVRLENREATLTTMRHPKATEQDCKIDAVLVAKAVMDAYPKDVARIKLVLNTSNSDTIQEVTVTTGDIKAYATGTISKDDLLTSLELKKFEPSANEQEGLSDLQTDGSKPAAPGAFRSQRQLLAGRIEKLKARGTGTQPFEEMLAKIETDAQKPSTDMPKATLLQEIRGLDGHLYEQEEAIRAAQHPGVIESANSKNQRYFQGQPGQERGGPAEGQGGGRKQGGFWMTSARINGKIREMQSHGTNVSSYQRQMGHIHRLFMSGDTAEAEKQLQILANQLGKNGNGGR